MDNFRTPYNETCTSKSIIDKIHRTGLLPGVKNPKYSEILEVLSVDGYVCYAEPVETFATASRMAWCPTLVYRKSGETELTRLCFPNDYLSIQYTDAIEYTIEAALDIILDKKQQPEYGKN